MSELPGFTILRDHAEYELGGIVSLKEAVDLVTTAIGFARDQHVTKLLVDGRGLTGFDAPSVLQRYLFINEWGAAADDVVCVAVLVREELLDPQRFGATVAQNIGFLAEAFTAKEEALKWLASPAPEAHSARVGLRSAPTTGLTE